MEKQTSLVKAFRVLEQLARDRSMGVSRLSTATGYPPATVHRILATLAELGYVRQTGSDRRYRLGLNLLKLTAGLVDSLDIATIARPVMREVMDQTGETVNLVVFEGDEAVYIEQVNNPRSLLRMFTKVGARAPLYCSGVGKAYLATMDQEHVRAYCERVKMIRFTEHTLATSRDLDCELRRIRETGYARDREEVEIGVACVSAVVKQRERVVGGLSISGPSNRLTDDRAPELGRRVKLAADLINTRITNLGHPLNFE